MAVVVANGKAQLIDREGRSLLSGDFTDLKPLGESMLAVKDSTGQMGLDRLPATPLSTKRYDEVGEMSDSLAAVRVGQKYGYVDPQGKETIAVNLTAFDDMARARFSDGWPRRPTGENTA